MTDSTPKLTPKEKMKIPRQEMPEQASEARRRNFLEVPFGFNAETAMREASRCRTPPARTGGVVPTGPGKPPLMGQFRA